MLVNVSQYVPGNKALWRLTELRFDPEADANVGNTIKADYVNLGKPGNWHFGKTERI